MSPKRSTWALAANWLLLVSSAPTQGWTQRVFRSSIDVVTVNVVVLKGEQPVGGLTASDFALSDNSVPQVIESLAAESVPIDLTLVLTAAAMSAESITDQLASIEYAKQVRSLLRRDDQLRIVWVEDFVRAVQASSELSLRSMRPVNYHRGVALIDGLFYALAYPVGPDRRHLILAFTDGADTQSTLPPQALRPLVARTDAVLCALFWAQPGDGSRQLGGIGMGRPEEFAAEWIKSHEAVTDAARQTGGFAQRMRADIGAVQTVVQAFRQSYVLRYSPRNVPTVGWHDIRVRVTLPGSFNVRARKGYDRS